jgi:hypothetical protein
VSVRERASEIERERESESARKRVDGQQSGLGNTEPWAQPAVNGDVVVVNLGFALNTLISHKVFVKLFGRNQLAYKSVNLSLPLLI